jgi:hypothetical protein
LKAGCELFLRYTTRTSALELEDFSAAKRRLIERGNQFADTSIRARATIAELGARFIRPGCLLLTHGMSRVVLALLQRAVASVSAAAAAAAASYRHLHVLSEDFARMGLICSARGLNSIHVCLLALCGIAAFALCFYLNTHTHTPTHAAHRLPHVSGVMNWRPCALQAASTVVTVC